jgi:hypothetical protein
MDQSESDTQEPEAPEPVRNLRWAIFNVRKYKAELLKCPVLGACISALVLGFYAGRVWDGRELSIAGDNIRFLTNEVSSYKDKLNGASPEQAAKQIAALQSEVAQQKSKLQVLMPDAQRRLTDRQKNFISSHAKDFKALFQDPFIYSWSEGDAPEYANAFVQAFQQIGVNAGGIIDTACDDDQRGVLVAIAVVGHPSADAARFKDLLTQMRLNPHYTWWNTDPNSKPEFALLICG